MSSSQPRFPVCRISAGVPSENLHLLSFVYKYIL